MYIIKVPKVFFSLFIIHYYDFSNVYIPIGMIKKYFLQNLAENQNGDVTLATNLPGAGSMFAKGAHNFSNESEMTHGTNLTEYLYSSPNIKKVFLTLGILTLPGVLKGRSSQFSSIVANTAGTTKSYRQKILFC